MELDYNQPAAHCMQSNLCALVNAQPFNQPRFMILDGAFRNS